LTCVMMNLPMALAAANGEHVPADETKVVLS
jgi:hypothetical protein